MTRRLVCDVCGSREKFLFGRDWSPHHMCDNCYERLDSLDRDLLDPAFHFAAAFIHNREASAYLMAKSCGCTNPIEAEDGCVKCGHEVEGAA